MERPLQAIHLLTSAATVCRRFVRGVTFPVKAESHAKQIADVNLFHRLDRDATSERQTPRNQRCAH